MGNLAIRLQGLDRTLLWDVENMRIINLSENDEARVVTGRFIYKQFLIYGLWQNAFY
jgi:hypothetical protein